MEILSCKNLTFCYNGADFNAVDDCSFSVNQGELVMLCGKSGCGKTTLLELLKRDTAPSGKLVGDIKIFGKSRDEMSDYDSVSKLGFVMQNPDNQSVCDKVKDELCFGLESLGKSHDEIMSAVGEMADYFGIAKLCSRNISELSGGEKQLVNLCAAMAVKPDILLLDEPTAQLDPVAAGELVSVLVRLNNELGLTIIVSEHNPEELFHVCDKVMLMDNGKIIKSDTPKAVGKALINTDKEGFLPSPARLVGKLNKDETAFTVKEGRKYLLANFSSDMTEENIIVDSSEPALIAKGLCQRYSRDGQDVVFDCDLTVQKNEIYAILGMNGAGKTTLINTLSGIVKAYSGSVKIFGKKLEKYKNGSLYRGLCGVVPQNPKSLFVKESVRADLEYAAKATGGYVENVEKAVNLTGIENLLDRHPYDLSGGELQRCALARVLTAKPKILFVDELTKGMDFSAKNETGQLLRKLKAEGMTIIMITHDADFAAEYCDRCGLFFDKKIVSQNITNQFLSQNSFYTTAVCRMTKGLFGGVTTVEQAVKKCSKQCCGGKNE